MKKLTSLALILILSTVLKAQITPQPSPSATFTQTIGVTEIFVDYSRPSVKDRKVFGELVPFQEVWRTGANASTKIEFSNGVEINGVFVNAGIYALMSRPGKSSWEIYLYSDLEVTQQTFMNSIPAYTINAIPKKVDFTESFIIYTKNILDDNALLCIRWETTEVELLVNVDNVSPIINALSYKNDEMAGYFQQSAEYLLQKNQEIDLALSFIDKSIILKETFRNQWVKAQLLIFQNKYKDALIAAQRAKELGNEDPVYSFFSESIENTILDLKSKTIK